MKPKWDDRKQGWCLPIRLLTADEKLAIERARPQWWVYFVQAGSDGPIKIGVALDVEKRRTQLQEASWEKLTILARVPGDQGTERMLHEEFRDFRIRGEWFRPDPVLLTFIDSLREELRKKVPA